MSSKAIEPSNSDRRLGKEGLDTSLMQINHAQGCLLWRFYHAPVSNRPQITDSIGIINVLCGPGNAIIRLP
jgi:hypothetical protein